MFACKTIIPPKRIPLLERISTANKQISEWHQSLERQFDHQTDMLRLARYEENGREYRYEYEIVRRMK
jgi:hypothetical protein